MTAAEANGRASAWLAPCPVAGVGYDGVKVKMDHSTNGVLQVDGFSAELTLITDCGKAFVERGDTPGASIAVPPNLDWETLISLASEHGMMPVLCRQLSLNCGNIIAPNVLMRLRSAYQANAVRNVRLCEELVNLFHLFETAGIAAIAYKGPALAATAYGSIALRAFCDLDLLIHKEDAAAATDVMHASGYRCDYNGAEHHFEFIHDVRQTRVEIHWDITPKTDVYPIRLDRFWPRLVPVLIGGRTVRTFAPGDTLLVLCVHGPKHRWHRLAWSCDVARVAGAAEGVPWDQTLSDAKSLGAHRRLLLGLHLAQRIFGLALPDRVEAEIGGDRAIPMLAHYAYEKIRGGDMSGNDFYATAPFYVHLYESRWTRSQRLFFHVRQMFRFEVEPAGKQTRHFATRPSLRWTHPFSRVVRLVWKCALAPKKAMSMFANGLGLRAARRSS